MSTGVHLALNGISFTTTPIMSQMLPCGTSLDCRRWLMDAVEDEEEDRDVEDELPDCCERSRILESCSQRMMRCDSKYFRKDTVACRRDCLS